jgi:hypothetical protein
MQYLKSVAYGNGVYVAVGENGPLEIQLSSNGVDWTAAAFQQTFDNSPEFDEVVFGNGQFVVVGDDGFIGTSEDGVQWQARHSPTDRGLRGVTYGKDSFMIVGNNETILQSGFKALRLTAMGKSAEGFELLLEGALGSSVDLQAATTLFPADWKTIQSLVLTSSETNVVDAAASTSPRYYRAIAH